MPPLLEVNNIEVVYNDIIQVLRGVSLNVKTGVIGKRLCFSQPYFYDEGL